MVNITKKLNPTTTIDSFDSIKIATQCRDENKCLRALYLKGSIKTIKFFKHGWALINGKSYNAMDEARFERIKKGEF